MDPSLSISSDPQHHPSPQFAGFPFAPYAAGGVATSQSLPFFAGAVRPATSTSHVFQAPLPPATVPDPPPQPAASLPPRPSFDHPPYSDMICSAIASLNEPDGSSKQAISRYIERVYTGLPIAHGALLTHHLKTLKKSGILAMVKKSYKFASTPPPTSVSVAAAAGQEAPRSDLPSNTTSEHAKQLHPDQTSASAPTAQKRGRGRPPKPKPESKPSEATIETKCEKNDMSVFRPDEEVQPTRRPPGRPKKNGAPTAAQPTAAVGIMKRRGRPPGRRAAGRQRKPKSVAASATVYAYVANGVKRRGRPKRVDSGVTVAPANAEGVEAAMVLPAKRGRPPKIGGVIRKPMKPKRGISRTGRPVGRPRKNAQWGTGGGSGQQDTSGYGYGELKRRFDLWQEKVKEAVNVLRAEVSSSDNQALLQAVRELEGLTAAMDTSEPPVEPNPEPDAHAQTEAEAMQEALF